ncbi:protein transport protein Sec16A-like isoform X2 [Watersipora subatra]|uniref:protein transport protein Sec16A-like isoform X2 n=1 Tax=Watersipora subatra TaxID=2589382 RepID=UPI00355C9229
MTNQPMVGSQQMTSLPVENQQMPNQMINQQMGSQQTPNQRLGSQQITSQPVGNQKMPTSQMMNQPVINQQMDNQPMGSQQTSKQPIENQQLPNQPMNSQPIPNQNIGNQPMGNYGMNYGMMGNGMMNTNMMGYPPQQMMYPGMMMPGQYPGMFPYGNQQPNMYNQMDPQMQQRMAMMKGFKPLTQQQLSGNTGYHQGRHMGSNAAAAPVRAGGPMVGQHPAQSYATPQPQSGYQQYGNESRMPRNQSFGGYRLDDSYSSYRDDDYSGSGRPRSKDVYEERRGYGYGSRPSSRSASRPSSRTGSAAAGIFQTEVNPYLMNQSGFSPRPPSRTSSRLDSAYQRSHTADESSSDEEEAEPSEPQRMTPAKFPMPHLIPRIMSNGDTLEVQPHNPADGQPATICFLRRPLHQLTLLKFPGPLVKGQTHKRDVLDYCLKMAQVAREDSTLFDRDSTELLWKFLHLFVKQNGTYVGSDIAELLLEGFEVDSTLYSVQAVPKANANMTQQETIDRFRQLVMFGDTKEALEWAMSTDQWGHALFLSSKMGSRIHAHVLTRFANSSMTYNDPLQTLYQLMSNRQPTSATHPEDGWGTWRPHLAMMLCNPSSDSELNTKSITSLGDALAARGLLHASHFCYLMAGLPLEPYTKKSAKLSMLGIPSGVSIEEYTQPDALELTEIYEYARSLAGEVDVIPHLQICKFFHARRQVDQGQPTEALAYLEAIANKVSPRPELFSWAFMSQLHSLAEKLKYHDAEATYVRDGRSLELEWITALATSLQAKLAISASGEVVGSPLHERRDMLDQPDASAGFGNQGTVPCDPAPPVQDHHNQNVDATTYNDSANTIDKHQQVANVAGDYPNATETHNIVHKVTSTTDILQQVTDMNNTYQQVPDTYQQVPDTASTYQQLPSTNYEQQPEEPANYEPPVSGYNYQTPSSHDQQNSWQASCQMEIQNTDYSLGSYNQPEVITQYENQGYTIDQNKDNAAPLDRPSEGDVPSFQPAAPENSSYQAQQPVSVPSTNSTSNYGAGFSYSSSAPYGAPPGAQAMDVQYPTSQPPTSQPPTSQPPLSRNLAKTASSRQLSTSGSNKSLAEGQHTSPAPDKEPTASIKSEEAATKARSSPAKSSFGFGIGSLFSKILPKGKNEIILPDDSKQSIVWDDKLKKWVDTQSDGTEAPKAAPPPTDMTLGRSSPAVGHNSSIPAPQPAGGNLYSRKKGKGSKYVDVMGKTAGTSLTPIPQHLFDVTPRSTPTSSIFTPTPSSDENGDSLPAPEAAPEMTGDSQHFQPQYDEFDAQMPRNTSMASLEVQNIMGGPPNSPQAPPVNTQVPPTNMQAPPTSMQAPPTSMHAPPTGMHAPPTNTHAPPMSTLPPPASADVQPASQHTNSEDNIASQPSGPPRMFNPSQFKMPSAAPGGRTGTLSSRNRYPK